MESPERVRDHSLRYSRRLHHPWEYKRFFTGNEVVRLSECTVFRISNPHGHFRLGITFKARGSSVERNIVKRRIREAFRTRAERLGAFDYNVVVPGSKKLAFPFEQKLRTCLEKELDDALLHARAAR